MIIFESGLEIALAIFVLYLLIHMFRVVKDVRDSWSPVSGFYAESMFLIVIQVMGITTTVYLMSKVPAIVHWLGTH